ncbi:MAG: oxidoreductase [Pseudarthrobacter sp.]|nr:oxidoreductase [Pseudarthrobacter sp.]
MTQQSAFAATGTTAPVSGAEPAPAPAQTARPRIALVGVHGFGERHLANLARLEASGAVELVAVADPHPPQEGKLAASVAVFNTLDQLLASGNAPDIVILATPIQTHAPLALAALAAGSDVYVEKPPVASMTQFREVLAATEASGKLVQVGFQSLGSLALPAIRESVAAGEIGDVLGLSAKGMWLRTQGYFKRSRWAGKRSLDGTDVVDGVATNALAHAVATGLHMAGAHTLADVASVETDLYRANNTQSDDTSVLRVHTTAGQTLLCALTLCAPEQQNPSVTVHGTQGEITFFYTEDEVVTTTPAGERRETFGRTDLLENLLAARSTGDPLLCSLADTGAFTSVLEAIRTAPDPQEIPAEYLEWEGNGDDAHPIVTGIPGLIERAAKAQATFAELGVPWARSLPPVQTFQLAGHPVADYQDGSHIRAVSSPRPYLHPVRTQAGTVVTDHQPLDHVWHLGVGVALQDVDGVNFWGGRTYTRAAGEYIWRPDHGTIVRTEQPAGAESQRDGRLAETLAWNGPDGAPVLTEQRTWTWDAVSPATWRLTLDFALSPAGDHPVSLGSPGSNGRHEGGYGGFFWRLPECAGARVWAPGPAGETLTGEAAVHGSVTPWLAWSGTFDGGAATLVFVAAADSTDRWFVRVDGYPGVGQSLAWDAPVIAEPGTPVRRSVTVFIADGILGTEDIQTLINSQGDIS